MQPIFHNGQRMWLLSDPLQLSERQLLLPPVLARLLVYCDGRHTVEQMRRALSRDLGESVPLAPVADTLRQLDEAYLLENGRSAAAVDGLRVAYRAQAVRPAMHAGRGYPSDARALRRQFERYGAADVEGAATVAPWYGRGVISPHIDYQRGGPVYAQVWRRAAAAVQAADLVLMFGTDHRGGPASLTLTPLPYATPYGVIPTDTELVDALAETIGPENAYRLELNHRDEWAIELSAVWLHHARQGEMCPMVPVLVGSFYHLTPYGHPQQDENFMSFIDTVRDLTRNRRVLAVASVDYSHVGPAFDQPDRIMDATRRAALTDYDAGMRQTILAGDADGFYNYIAPSRNDTNICGFSSIYLLLQYLQATSGIEVAYTHCSADAADESLVSIGGMLLD